MKGSMTIEISYIMPVVFLVFVMTVLCTFYFHDKCILHGIAYEAGIIGSQNHKSSESISTEELATTMIENNKNKFVLFDSFDMNITENNEWLIVEVWAKTDRFSISTSRSIPLVNHEKTVRNINKIGSIING